MKALPEGFDPRTLPSLLADTWGFDVATAEYAPVGAGSYHWVVAGCDGRRGFVTVDDLDHKPWLGNDRDSVFDGLRSAFDTAVALRDAGLRFVVAPIPTSGGETVRRVGPRYTIALFPFLDGQAGRSSEYETADERAAVARMLAELHAATPAAAAVVRTFHLDVPGRRLLEAALGAVSDAWLGGPFSEPARQALAARGSDLAALLALADRLALDVARRSGGDWVVTHGEPHTRNVMRTDPRLMLLDWDTAALAPPERDLWMVVSETGEEAAIYANATGHAVDDVAASFFRLAWDLGDLASYLDVLRSPHRRDEDTVKAYERVISCLTIRDQWAALLD